MRISELNMRRFLNWTWEDFLIKLQRTSELTLRQLLNYTWEEDF